MATPQITKTESPYTEAPASWNTRYVTPAGFICQITLRFSDLDQRIWISSRMFIRYAFYIAWAQVNLPLSKLQLLPPVA